jgi:hypothetical protein
MHGVNALTEIAFLRHAQDKLYCPISSGALLATSTRGNGVQGWDKKSDEP